MFAPAGQTTARAGLRSKLAALVVRRQAPPNPRCRKQQSVGAGHARPATYPIPQLVAIAQQIPNMHLAQKSPSKFVEKIKNNP